MVRPNLGVMQAIKARAIRGRQHGGPATMPYAARRDVVVYRPDRGARKSGSKDNYSEMFSAFRRLPLDSMIPLAVKSVS